MKLWHSYDIVSPAIPKINFAAKLRNNYELSIMKGKIVWFLHVILPIVPMFMCRQTGNPWLLLFFFSIKFGCFRERQYSWFGVVGSPIPYYVIHLPFYILSHTIVCNAFSSLFTIQDHDFIKKNMHRYLYCIHKRFVPLYPWKPAFISNPMPKTTKRTLNLENFP